jgi:hypothetical protein
MMYLDADGPDEPYLITLSVISILRDKIICRIAGVLLGLGVC